MAEETFYRDQILCTLSTLACNKSHQSHQCYRFENVAKVETMLTQSPTSKRSSSFPRHLPHCAPRKEGRGQANLRSCPGKSCSAHYSQRAPQNKSSVLMMLIRKKGRRLIPPYSPRWWSRSPLDSRSPGQPAHRD
jgi:hypothetical protein